MQPSTRLACHQLSASLYQYAPKGARTSLTLTPAHGKHVFALAVITSAQENTLYAETVEQIQKDEQKNLVMAMRQEMALAVDLIKHTSIGIAAPWTEETSPLAASSCRVLGESPTGPDLDPIEPTQAKIPRLA